MECPGEIEVLGWMQGGLPAEILDRLDTHIDGCADCLAAVATLGVLRAQAAPAVASVADERYVVRDEIARGGMGQVFAATDRVLDRPVALKTVRDAASAARFAREMRITARLQHPAIVPVYDAGAFPDGEPFYVMRHVEGQTLDRASAAAATLAERLALLPAVMTAIDAVAYAHERGVIHRDLKPANVLVGRFGETVVLDWGIAKVLPEAEIESSDSDDGTGAVAPADALLTKDGAVIGTPAYMAPEQALGETADARSDVYGLGAILHHVLAGAPPGRALGPDVPAALAAIVERATAYDPDERYASARDLAEDLRRYLAGRLVAAHRYTARELVRRWVALHRAALVAAAVALVAIVTVGVVAVRRVVVARDDAEAQRAIADTNRRASDQHRAAAEQVVSLVVDDLRVRLEEMGRLDALAEVGVRVDDYYQRVPVRPGADGAEDLGRRGDALFILGDATFARGDHEEAAAIYARVEQLAAEAMVRKPSPGAARSLCLARLRRADSARAVGDLAAARRFLAGCGELLAVYPGPALRDPGIQVLVGIADVDRHEGKFDDALARLRAAEDAAAGLLSEARRTEILTNVRDLIGMVALDKGDVAAARAVLTENVDAAAAAAASGDSAARYRLAAALVQIGRVERRAGDPVAAVAALGRGQEVIAALVERDPDNLDWLDFAGTVHDQLGSAELERGRTGPALGHLTTSHAIATRLARHDPANVMWRRSAGVSAFQLGVLQRALGKHALARASFLEALAASEALAAKHPDDVDLQRGHAVTLLNLGDLDRELRRPEATAELEQSAAILRRLVERADSPRARNDLVSALLALADTQRGAAARPTLDEARTVLAPFRAAPPNPDIADSIAEVDAAWAKVQRR